MSLKFVGTYVELQSKLASLNGSWDDSHPNKKILKLNDGLMNWFESTGSINFQGKAESKAKLESIVPSLLYPSETIFVAPKSIEQSDEESVGVPEINQTESLERQFLTTGINEGELIIGIVSTVGTESARIIRPLTDRLKVFGYHVEEIRISSILPDFTGSPSEEYERIKHFMESGDSLRKSSDNNAILALGAMQVISEKRKDNPSKTAYILNSLKHPKEVELLRKVYSDGFYLIGIHNDEKRRRLYLTDDKGLKQTEADELIRIDENESIDHGQKTRDTYHLSDFFVNLGKNDDQVKNRLQRFLELIFSHPYKNPTFDEFAMFMAFNSSARSGDLSRQVGAVLCRDNQIIATGANDVPKSGGGLYWAEVNPSTGEICDHIDGKDYTREVDSNKQAQAEIITEIAIKLLDSGVVASDKEIDLRSILKQSKISDLTEFGRIVHAEMDALLSCARAGITTVDSTLYCTTFPCHNCAKHIIASGVKKVLYVEPYPKSRALDFHSESIELNSELDVSLENNGLVTFEPFIGVGPRRFLDLFSMTLGAGSKLKRKAKDGAILDWNKSTAPIRTPIIARSYIQIEASAVEMWSGHNDAMKKNII